MSSTNTSHTNKIVIEGITEDGRNFRPSDWAERISGSLCSFGSDRRIRYSRYLQPQLIDGHRCLAIDPALVEANPGAYKFLMDFAVGNHLKVRLPRPAVIPAIDSPTADLGLTLGIQAA